MMNYLTNLTPVYDSSFNLRTSIQAHGLSNQGNNGNRLIPRQQMLSNSTFTDSISGNIQKHFHNVIASEYFEAEGLPLCDPCKYRDSRRIAAIVDTAGISELSTSQILQQCASCDSHGFLITGKNSTLDNPTNTRVARSKASLVDFGFALGLPGAYAETDHVFTRSGETKEQGQMIFKIPARSGIYACCARYSAFGIGVDTNTYQVVITDQEERLKRHRAILLAFRDQFLSPLGAQLATMLPHLTELEGAIVIRKTVGRAPIYSPLEGDYLNKLKGFADEETVVLTFASAETFDLLMKSLIHMSYPAFPPGYQGSS